MTDALTLIGLVLGALSIGVTIGFGIHQLRQGRRTPEQLRDAILTERTKRVAEAIRDKALSPPVNQLTRRVRSRALQPAELELEFILKSGDRVLITRGIRLPFVEFYDPDDWEDDLYVQAVADDMVRSFLQEAQETAD